MEPEVTCCSMDSAAVRRSSSLISIDLQVVADPPLKLHPPAPTLEVGLTPLPMMEPVFRPTVWRSVVFLPQPSCGGVLVT